MQVLDASQTRARLPFERLIAALRGKFIEGSEAPLRHTHVIEATPDMETMERRLME